MADRSVATTDTLGTLRTTFNSLATDVGDIASITGASGTIASATDLIEAVVLLNTEVGAISAGTSVFTGSIVFEGATADAYETTLAVVDPTADRTITLPNLTGTVSLLDATETLSNKTLTSPTINTGAALKNADTSAGYLEFYEDSDNGTNKVTLIGPAATGDVTVTLPAATGTILTTGNSDAPATTTTSTDVDFILIDDGGTMKKITTANVGLATNAFAIAQAVALG